MANADSLQEILASVGKVLEGQAQLQSALEVLTEEQRQHGERLSNLEQKLAGSGGDGSNEDEDARQSVEDMDARHSRQSRPSSEDMASRQSLEEDKEQEQEQQDQAKSPVAKTEGRDTTKTTQDNQPRRTMRTMSSFVPWEDYDVRTSRRTSFMTEGGGLAMCGLPEDWPSCIKARRFGSLPAQTSALATMAGEIHDRITTKYMSMVALESKTHRGRCIFDPSSPQRILFDLMAMVFLLYDLCFTPVTIAWDFPMVGWLLYCTSAVAVFWTLDIIMTCRTAYYVAGKLETRPLMIFRRYCRTTFFLDLFIVCVDWLTVFANSVFPEETSSQASDNPEVIGAKLVRFSKATRVVRIVSVTRVVRIQIYLEHLGDRLHGGSSSKYVGDMARLIVIIIWINHVMSCTWFYIGRVAIGDTGTSWLNDPIRDETSPLYSETLPLFQYTTAFHWAITQMTPGSMQVFPRNSLERLFNIFALVFGMIFFSSLISSLSATMVNFRMKSTQTANQMAELRRFLRQADISNKLSLSVQKQANERLMEVKPLMVTDVKALGVLSADVRSELQFELCQPYLMRNGFYRVCQHVETAVLKSIMVDCITFTFYRAGEAAFEAGQDAKHAYFIERGTLEYQQNRRTSKVKRKLRVGAHNEIIIAEAALWTFWDHVGTLTAPNPASMLKMNVDKHTKIIAESELMGEFAAELALHFRTRLSMAKPPQAPWPNDIEVPCTSFDEMIVCASKIIRSLVSRIGLELVKDQVGQWASAVFRNHPKNIEELEKEVTKSKCMLMANTHGDVERLAAVSTINISRCDGTTLMQLGTWDPESGLRVSCKLPGTKQELGETAQEAMTRVLETDLLPFRGLVDLSQLPVHHEVEWSRSEKYNMRTKYLRTIFQLEVRNEMDLPQLQRLETDPSRDKGPPMVKRHSFRGFMGMSAGRTLTRRSGSQNKMDLDSLGCIADTHEIVGLPDGESQRVLICGWLHEEEVDRFRGEGEGKAVLERLMSRIHIDELVMSSVKDLTPTIVPISDGSEVVARDRTVSYDNRTDEKSMDTRSVDNRSEELYGILGALPKDAHALDD